MKKIIYSLLALMLPAVISNAQDDKQNAEPGKVYTIAEEMPKFAGGEDALKKYLSDNIKYPESAKVNKEQGTVFVQFIVDAEGKVIEPKILRGATSDLDAEALRVISNMPQWTPGRQDGKAVKVVYNLPIGFKL